MKRALAAVLLSGCASYHPGDLRPIVPSQELRSLACLDVRVTAGEAPPGDPADVVLTFDFGNRCDRPVPVDFGALRITDCHGRDAPVFDPRREIRPVTLDANAGATEWLEVQPPGPTPLARLCVDVSGLEAGAHAAVDPICTTPRGEVFACAR